MDKSLEEIIENIVVDLGYKLYDIELTTENGKNIFRVYILKEGGISLDDCVKVSHAISPILDLKEPIKSQYFFEVSSPGIERKLTKKRHFENSIGEMVKISDGEKIIKGKLISFNGENVVVDNNKEKVEIPFEKITKAKTYFDWSKIKI